MNPLAVDACVALVHGRAAIFLVSAKYRDHDRSPQA